MPRLRLFSLVLGILCLKFVVGEPQISEYFDQDDFSPVKPCNEHRPNDPDLTTYDIISSFHFDEFHSRNEGVQQIIGSTGYQTAYHLEEYSNMTIESTQAFPKGVPNEFSFECTFRVPQQQPLNEWNLFELTDYRFESQMSVTINPIYNTIDFSLPKYDGSVQTVSFEETEIFDRSWHKVMFGITQDTVRLWVDCKPVPDLTGTYRAPLDVRGPIDASEGSFSIARDCRTKHTVPIDVQWMIFSCDAEKPERTNCMDLASWQREHVPLRPQPLPLPPLPQFPPLRLQPLIPLPQQLLPTLPPTPTLQPRPEPTRRPSLFFEVTTSERPWLSSSTPAALVGQEINACPVQCPAGLPGPPGPPGPQGPTGKAGTTGLTGPPGPIGPAGVVTNAQYERVTVQGEKGARGLPGIDGLPGQPGRPGQPAPIIPGTTTTEKNVEATTTKTTITETTPLAGLDEREVRDICMAVVREYISEYTSTLTGPPGPPGQRGRSGNPGVQGIAGEPGIRGAQGERGYPGLPGSQGPPGETGARGPEGLKGDRGDDGIGRDGPVGPPGLPGEPGRNGREGPTGHPGDRGETGAQGTQGVRGPPGAPGNCPDCSAQMSQYVYPLIAAQQQYNSKGPQGYYNNKGPQAYYNNKGPQDYSNKG